MKRKEKTENRDVNREGGGYSGFAPPPQHLRSVKSKEYILGRKYISNLYWMNNKFSSGKCIVDSRGFSLNCDLNYIGII